MSNSIYTTAKVSLYAQVITGLIDFLALQVDVEKTKLILKQLLALELVVQAIEATFYIWLVNNFHSVNDITRFRYFDWFFSTSLMLFTLIVYLSYLRDENKTLGEIVIENKKTIQNVIILNYMMLQIGYLGETGVIDMKTSVYLGFMPFLLYYKIIYDNFVKDEVIKSTTIEKKKEIKGLFWYFFSVWSVYGVAALFPYKEKNISYNILDLFSKNFFGLFLSYKVYVNKKFKNSKSLH